MAIHTAKQQSTARTASHVPFFGVDREFAAHREVMLETVAAVLETGKVLQGEAVKRFETNVAAAAERQQAVAVGSCTDALFFALQAAGIGAGDEVLVTDFSFIASASCIVRAGATPVFVDVDDSYNLDLERAQSLLSPRSKALIYVHLYGNMGDPTRLEAFAKANKLLLIEDSAQAFGAHYQGRPAGSLGQLSCVSFDPTKPLSAPGSGGILLCDDDALAEQLRRLRYHGKDHNGDFPELGYNSQMPSLTAALLDFKLQQSPAWTERRRTIAAFYCQELTDLPLQLPHSHAEEASRHIYHKFVLRSKQRDALKQHLEHCGVQSMVHYAKPLHQQPYLAAFAHEASYYPNTLRYASEVLSLPIHPFLHDEEVTHVTESVQSFFR